MIIRAIISNYVSLSIGSQPVCSPVSPLIARMHCKLSTFCTENLCLYDTCRGDCQVPPPLVIWLDVLRGCLHVYRRHQSQRSVGSPGFRLETYCLSTRLHSTSVQGSSSETARGGLIGGWFTVRGTCLVSALNIVGNDLSKSVRFETVRKSVVEYAQSKKSSNPLETKRPDYIFRGPPAARHSATRHGPTSDTTVDGQRGRSYHNQMRWRRRRRRNPVANLQTI